jgi:acetylornithine deacetylase/succinyl-diaminopimelate desuccinylase-like protein
VEVTEAGIRGHIEHLWDHDVVPTLADYTRIPCVSPAYEPEWELAGEIRRAAVLLRDWCASRAVTAIRADVLELPGRTPVLVVEAPATGGAEGTVLVYGHLDKQPPLGEWRPGLGPYSPVIEEDRLYGRGTADDGYAVFAALSALEAMDAAGIDRPRVVVLVEASEESGSPDLDAHLSTLDHRLGRPDLVVCLDSGCLTYDRLWTTTSLRGILVATVRVDVLLEGVHSGLAGGVVPSSFRILRSLLSRIEGEGTGEILLPELRADVPPSQRRSLETAAQVATEGAGAPEGGDGGSAGAGDGLPVVDGLRLAGSPGDRLVAKAWAPALEVTGMDGIPSVQSGGNVLRPFTEAKLSLRLPPTADAAAAAAALQGALAADPPAGASVRVTIETGANGWLAPEPEPWVADAVRSGSLAAFGKAPGSYGEGGTIPFLPMLGQRFTGVQMVAIGVLGPHSNAHGPNEFLHLPMAKGVTVALVHLIGAAGRARTSTIAAGQPAMPDHAGQPAMPDEGRPLE